LNLIKQEDWIELIDMEYIDKLGKLGTEDQVRMFFDLIQKVPHIKTYIEEHQVKLSLNRTQEVKEFVVSIPEKVEEIIKSDDKPAQGGGVWKWMSKFTRPLWVQAKFNTYVKKNLEHFVFALDPEQAVFFLAHREELIIPINMLQRLQGADFNHISPEIVLDLLTQALPDNLKNQVPQTVKVNANIEELFPELQVSAKQHLDESKIIQTISDVFSRFIDDASYHQMVEKAFEHLTDTHLKVMLNALYPDEKNNEDKFKLITDFRNDLNMKKSSREWLPKYFQLKDGVASLEEEDSDFYRIQTYIYAIYEEILKSVCHYKDMSLSGDSSVPDDIQFIKLQEAAGKHEIWECHDTSRQDRITEIAKKSHFLVSILKALPEQNKLEGLKNQPVKEALTHVAEFVIAPTQAGVKDSQLLYDNECNLNKAQKTSKELSTQFGGFFAKGQSLTQEQVENDNTEHFSAIDDLKERAGIAV
jgi:hypothetical protein